MTSILITQCLQNDFVKLIGKYEPLPNLLHIGHSEALRLVGEDLESSPLNQVLGWAYQQCADKLELIHVRDWHDEADHGQHDHLNHFGAHCLKDSPGAEFIFQIPKDSSQRPVKIVNSPGLNDFEGTSLNDYLSPYNLPKVKLGIVGVWTEAKITYLAYEIRTRYPQIEVAICSALVASSTRSQHYASLGQLEKILGVRIIDSVAEFVSFLGDPNFKLSRPVKNKPTIELQGTPVLPFKKETLELIEYLFRDCLEVKLKILDGGFSGNFVLGCESTDMNGRQQVPHVLKIGKRELIAKERTSFEQVEQLLGNSAPRVVDFADAISQGAIKYRYASMGEGNSASFQKSFMKGLGLREVSRILDQVFSHQLGRLYMAAQMESCNLFDYYGFRADMASLVRASVNSHLLEPAEGNTISFFGKKNIPNPASFYEKFLPLVKSTQEQRYFSYVHGDLNAANIILDAHKNVWLIDFFHSHKGHVLKDVAKFENDLLYILTPVHNEKDLILAMEFTDALVAIKDLATIPVFTTRILAHPTFGRAARTIKMLRKFYPRLVLADIETNQLMIAQLRYAVHTLTFDEPNIWQRRWALYTASVVSAMLIEKISFSQELRVDWIPLEEKLVGKLGLTLLPGRRDRDRKLNEDLTSLKKNNIRHIYSLITTQELKSYGVPTLMKEYVAAGIGSTHVDVLDGAPLKIKETLQLVQVIDLQLKRGENVLIHCLGGLGRSGTLAAAYFIWRGMEVDEAIKVVRESRSARAIETQAQIKFLYKFKQGLL